MTAVIPLVLLFGLFVIPGRLPAQEHIRPGSVGPSAGTFVGLGAGPSPSGVWGVEGVVPISSYLALRAEYSRWASGIASECIQSWPDSYACVVGGQAGMAGVRASVPLTTRVVPFAELSGGRFGRKRISADSHTSTAVSLGVGARLGLFGGFAARIGGRFFRAFDDDYAALMDEKLQYTVGTIGVEYRVDW